jgi:uncharacterized repeat protein (TIGR03987 family)
VWSFTFYVRLILLLVVYSLKIFEGSKNMGAERYVFEGMFVLAIILYTVAIWGHRFYGLVSFPMKNFYLTLFGVALFCDIMGTVFLCVMSAVNWKWDFHTSTGVASLVIMAVHFGFAVHAKATDYRHTGHENNRRFYKYSPWAWLLWVTSFVSGLPLSKMF